MITLDRKEAQRVQKVPRLRKVHYGHYDREFGSPHPVIRIGGRYLTSYGFSIGDTIDVTFEPHRITITKVMS